MSLVPQRGNAEQLINSFGLGYFAVRHLGFTLSWPLGLGRGGSLKAEEGNNKGGVFFLALRSAFGSPVTMVTTLDGELPQLPTPIAAQASVQEDARPLSPHAAVELVAHGPRCTGQVCDEQ